MKRLAVKDDCAFRMNQAQQRQPCSTLARSGFADQTQRFSRAQLKAEGVNHAIMIDHPPQKPFADRKGDT